MKKSVKPFSGSHRLVAVFNRMLDMILERTILRGVGYDVEEVAGQGFRLKLKLPNVGAVAEIDQFVVLSVYKNHLLCKRVTLTDAGEREFTVADPFVPSDDSDVIRIAKPDELRPMSWDAGERFAAGLSTDVDGYEYEFDSNGTGADPVRRPWNKRTTTLLDGSDYLAGEIAFTDELIWPAYVEQHSIIYAAKVKTGTVFSVTEQIYGGAPPDDHEDFDVQWVDLNLAGRTFQPAYSKIKVCNGTQTGNWYALIRASDTFQEE